VRAPERLSIRARLRISIVALVTAIVVALSALHLHAVVDEALEDVGERARMLAEQVNVYLVEAVNRRAGSPATTFEETKAVWYDIVQSDPSIARYLQKTLVQSSSVIDVAIVDDHQRVLAAADASRVGKVADGGRSWREWQQRDLLGRILDLYQSNRDIFIYIPLGVAGVSEPVMSVHVALSPVLLRRSVTPTLRNLAAVSAISLAMSVFLAVIVSKLVSDSLERLEKRIDLIAQGDLKWAQQDQSDAPELINIESKLWWLGRQYSGARADILTLRSNVERMLRKLDEAIFVFGPDGRLHMAGESAQRLLGRPREELLGRSLSELFPAWTGVGHAIDMAMAAREPVREQAVSLERPNLPTVRLFLNVELIEYEDAANTGVLVTLRDAETRQQIQEGLDTARRLSAISRITSGVAHEIKNPLNAMMLHLEIAQEKLRGSQDPAPELEIVKRELLRLDRVVKALLDFNRPIDVEMQECDLNSVAVDVASLMRPQADARNVQLEVQHGSERATVLADLDLLKQGILNVAVNALEATPPGGKIGLSVQRAEEQYILAVEDSGPGIPAEIQDKIFNLYFTTKQSGTGVGLAMTYRIMQLHGGTITLDSEEGRGSCFRLGLPARQPTQVAA
jgi:signal transduction histidine kinase